MATIWIPTSHATQVIVVSILILILVMMALVITSGRVFMYWPMNGIFMSLSSSAVAMLAAAAYIGEATS